MWGWNLYESKIISVYQSKLKLGCELKRIYEGELKVGSKFDFLRLKPRYNQRFRFSFTSLSKSTSNFTWAGGLKMESMSLYGFIFHHTYGHVHHTNGFDLCHIALICTNLIWIPSNLYAFSGRAFHITLDRKSVSSFSFLSCSTSEGEK